MQICKTVETHWDEVITETFDRVTNKVDEVCDDLPWPLDWFCHAVVTVIRWVETIVRTIVHVVFTVVCTPIDFALEKAGELINRLLDIPIIGALIRWVRGAVLFVVSQVVGLADTVGGLFGILPTKRMSLHIIVLMKDDRSLTVDPALIDPSLRETERILRARAHIRVETTVHSVSEPTPSNARFVDSDAGFFGEDLTGAGSYFQDTIADLLDEDQLSLATGLFAPVIAFVVEGVGDARTTGCSGGPLADYLCIEPGVKIKTDNTLAHEVCHSLGLLHDNIVDGESKGDVTNLMFWSSFGGAARVPRGDNLSPFQRGLVRGSPHVSYL